jgi:hypothetical protein
VEQSALINAIYSTWKEEGAKVIITDSLSTMMVVSDRKRTKNPKIQTIRKLLDQQGGKITLLWVPGYVGITGNENASTADEIIQSTEKYSPQDHTKWIEWKHQEKQQEKWNNTTTEMKECKPHKDTQTMTRMNQVVISRFRGGYCRATHAAIMNHEPRPECPFCGVPLTIDHILW